MADETEASLPFLPPPVRVSEADVEPSISPTDLPVAPDTETREPAGATPTLADRLATRNVPTSRSAAQYGLPVQTEQPVEPDEFVAPPLQSMGPSTTAMLIGRGLMVVAMLLIGIAARRTTGPGRAERGEAFWPVAASAGVFVAVGIAGLVFWSVTLADNGRRLKARSATPRAVGWAWAAPIIWVVVSALTYLRLEVDAEVDPFPGIAGIVFAALLAIAYAQLQRVFTALSRRPPNLWVLAFPIDLVAFGVVWWRLTSWPDPVSVGDADHVRLTAYVAFGAAAALTVNALVFVLLAQRGSSGVYERLGRLETRHRGGAPPGPEWFAVGLQLQRDAPVDQRALVDTGPLSWIVALFHGLWGVSLVVFGILMATLAFEYSDSASFDGMLAIDDDDTRRVVTVAGVVALAYVATIIVHAVWSVLVALNARRVTVHAPNPATFGIVFAPMPVLVVIGLLIGGRVGYWVVMAGLAFAFLALARVNQMLASLSAGLGGELRGFSNWTALIGVAYVVGVVENLVITTTTAGRLGLFAAASVVQGAVIVFGGVVGFRAMRALEQTLSTSRQARRADST